MEGIVTRLVDAVELSGCGGTIRAGCGTDIFSDDIMGEIYPSEWLCGGTGRVGFLGGCCGGEWYD